MTRATVRARGSVDRPERGATLIEALITIALIGTGVVAVLGALQVAVTSSIIHQHLAIAESALRTAAEDVKAAPFVACADAGDYGGLPTLPGVLVRAVAVEHWDGTLGSERPYAGGCAHGGWPQLITIVVEMPDAPVTLTVQTEIVKRVGS